MQAMTLKRPQGKIGFALIVLSVLIAVVPLGIVVAIAINLFQQQAEEQATNQMNSLAEAKENDIERWLDSSETTLDLILTNPEQYTRMVTILRSEGRMTSAVASVDFYLTKQLDLQTSFEEFYIYNLEGEIRASSNQTQEGKNVAPAPYFQRSLIAQQIQVPYFDSELNQLTMVITRRIFNNAGAAVGVFAGRLNMNSLSEIMTSTVGLGETGETYIVISNREDKLLVTPTRFTESVTMQYTSLGIENALRAQEGNAIYTSYRDRKVIGVYRYIPKLQAAMLAEIEQNEALGAVYDVRQVSMLVTAAAAAVAVGVALLGTLWITRPIRKLTEVATAVMNGDYTSRAQVRRNNEIGQLATAFNTMTDNLLKTLDDRSQKIQEVNEANKQLRIATAKAREAARVKGEFLATVSHELRTPLNAIIGFSDMLLIGMAGELNEKQAHQINRMKENGNRLLSLINNILDITRIEAGRTELVLASFDPRQFAQRVYAQNEVLAQNANLQLEVGIDPDLPEILIGDEKRLEQIAVNLLSNAIKFTDQGAVRFDLRANSAKGEWTLEVADTGIGIPPHAIDYIFEEFRQVDGSSTRAYKGSGLGLTITRNLVRLMDGKINVKSKLGVGSTFTVTLPLIALDTEIAPEIAEPIGI